MIYINYLVLRFSDIILSALTFSSIILRLFTRKRRKNINSYLVKNLFKEADIIDFFDRNITAKTLGDDLDYIGFKISKKAYSTIKLYLALIVPIIYILISVLTLNKVNYLFLGLYSFIIFVMLFTVPDMFVKIAVKFTMLNIRFEFINFLGAWSRNIQLGSNFIASLEKSANLINGALKQQVIYLISDIKASTPIDVAIRKFGQSCRDKEIIGFCDSMANDLRDGADITNYVIDVNKRIQNDKAQLINTNTKTWKVVLSILTGIIIFFSFAVYLMLYVTQKLSA